MDMQCSLAMESLEIFCDSVKCQKCGIAIPLLRTVTISLHIMDLSTCNILAISDWLLSPLLSNSITLALRHSMICCIFVLICCNRFRLNSTLDKLSSLLSPSVPIPIGQLYVFSDAQKQPAYLCFQRPEKISEVCFWSIEHTTDMFMQMSSPPLWLLNTSLSQQRPY